MVKTVTNTLSNVPNNSGLLFSGGADSTLLLYLLSQQLEMVHAITICYNTHNNVEELVTKRLIGVIGDNITHHVYKLDRSDTGSKDKDFARIAQNLNLPHYVSGLTLGPPAEVQKHFPFIQRVTLETKDNYLRSAPLSKGTAKDTYAMYCELGIDETILPLTVSCSSVLNLDDHPCGECWWCLEKKWGMG